MTKTIWILAVMWPALVMAGIYPPAAGAPGSTAIYRTDARFVAWANGNLTPEYGTDVDDVWKVPAKAYGPATEDPMDIVCLGNGGRITMYFPHPIRDGAGADFAVFENSFNHTFLELGFAEVSSDGVNYFRFPAISDTPAPAGGFGGVDATNIHNLAGKYRGGYGTPFDLAEVADSPLLDKQRVRFVRIVDIIGDGSVKDSRGFSIYDPTPVVGSGGFDLDAIGVIHQNDGEFRVTRAELAGTDFRIEWESNPGSRYRVETSLTMAPPEVWQPVGGIVNGQASDRTLLPVPATVETKRFWRVVRLE